jgi:predicted DNA-binding protein (MmcQ/YjbR family)
MTIDTIREYCLSMKAVTESFPFDEDALVFKVKDKMFALLSLQDRWLNLKCDPEKAIALREQYDTVIPGYHMNKKYWNTIDIKGNLSEKILKSWITDSYNLVVKKLPLRVQKELARFG